MYNLSQQFIGRWKGTNQLYLHGGNQPDDCSQSFLNIAPVIHQQFLEFAYDWERNGKPQHGVILVGSDLKPQSLCGTWSDTWHQNTEIMNCRGNQDDNRHLTIQGSYGEDNGPRWKWRIAIQLLDQDQLEMTMYNITPQGQEELAVHARYRRDTAH